MTQGKSRTARFGRSSPYGVAAAAIVVVAVIVYSAMPETPEVAAALGALAVVPLAAFAWLKGQEVAARGAGGVLLSAAEASAEAVLVTGAGGSVVYANEAFRRLFPGVARGPQTLDSITPLAADEEAASEFARLVASANAGVAASGEFQVRAPAGGVEWRRVDAEPAGPFAVWRAEDITARRELESVRRSEENIMVDSLDHLPVGYVAADADGSVVYANQTLAAWLETTSEAMVASGLRLADILQEETAAGDKVRVGDATLVGPGGRKFPVTLVRASDDGDNGRAPASRSVVLRRDGPEVGARSPDAGGPAGATAAEERLRWLFEEAPVGIAKLDLDGVVTDCNRAFLKLLGIHRDVVVGRPFAERVSKEDRSDVAAQLSKVVMGTAKGAHLDVRLAGAQRERVVDLFASRIQDRDGEIAGVVAHFIDTTEQRDLEIQFAQSQKMQAVGQLAGGVAHDFNNLLTAMIGFTDLLLARHGPDDPSFADIMQVKQNANRAANLVRQLLAFSRKQTMKPIVLDPHEALADLSNLLRRLIGEHVELAMEHGRDLGMIKVDRGQFDQVIINLAVNGRDAMPRGGTLTIRTAPVVLQAPEQRGLDVVPAGSYVLVAVADTGVGIPKENLIRIFEPFFSTKEVGAGTGLGLSTVWGIVHQSGGFVFVDSAVGEGTTFSIYLPRFDAEAAPKAAASPEFANPATAMGEADLTGVGTVLLVEDEDAVRLFGARALRNKGYRVLEARNGETALDVINGGEQAIDLIISDVVMPGMDGHTLIRLVRQELPRVKVILMSGYAEDVYKEDLARDASVHFLAKPFSLKALAGKVKEVLQG